VLSQSGPRTGDGPVGVVHEEQVAGADVGTSARPRRRPLDPVSIRARRSGRRPHVLPRWVRRTLLVYLASRLLVAVAVLMALGIAAPLHPHVWWQWWDSFWYLDIAQHGYPTTIQPLSPERPFSALAFFPLWPLLIRVTGVALGGHPVLAAYLLNFVLGGVLALLVRKLFATVADASTADLGVLLFVFFPGTNVFSAAYSEPLALCLAAACLLSLMAQRWVLAGSFAALVGATRPPVAVAVFAALAWVVLAALRRREWRAAIALPLAPLGILAFALYAWRHTGRLLAWHDAEKLFGNQVDFGRNFFTGVTRVVFSDVRAPVVGSAVLVYLSILILLGLAGFFVWRPPPALLVLYSVVIVGVPAIDSALMPKVRFLAAAFPLFLPLARYLRRPGREPVVGVVVAAEGGLLIGFTMLHLLSQLAFP
jgi:hypothetical protein